MTGPNLNPARGRSFASAGSVHWGTPRDVFDALDREFDFDLDPCPGEATYADIRTLGDGLTEDWDPSSMAFVNPPYGRELKLWLEKGIGWTRGPSRRAVFLLPSRTDTSWWHDMVLPNAREIRFLRGRIGYTGVPSKPEKDRQKQRSRAPFPSVVVVF